MMSQKDKLDKILIFQPFRGAWIAEWYQSAAPWAMSFSLGSSTTSTVKDFEKRMKSRQETQLLILSFVIFL